MRQINIKNDTAVELLDKAVEKTGKGKTEVVITALKYYIKSLDANKTAEAAIRFVEEHIHPYIDPELLANPPSKEEQEELLGM